MLRKTAWTSISVGHDTAVSHPLGVTFSLFYVQMHIGEQGAWDSPFIILFPWTKDHVAHCAGVIMIFPLKNTDG
jgi:uncharacterized membrane protein YGL010W